MKMSDYRESDDCMNNERQFEIHKISIDHMAANKKDWLSGKHTPLSFSLKLWNSRTNAQKEVDSNDGNTLLCYKCLVESSFEGLLISYEN